MHLISTALAAEVPLTWDEWLALPQSQFSLAALGVTFLVGVGGWLSAISSARSAGTAKKNLGVASDSLAINSNKANEENKVLNPDFTNAFYLKRSYATTYVFDVKVTNPASGPNSLVAAPLTLVLADGAPLHFDPVPLPPEMKTKTPLEIPLALNARAHCTGSLAYEVPSDLLEHRPIKRFRINFTDSNDRKTPIDTISIARHQS